MRISLVTDWWPPRVGGVESQVFDLARALASRSHPVHVLTTSPAPAPLAGVFVEHMAMPMAGPIAAPDLRRIRDIARRLAGASPHVVHAHGMFSSLAIGGVMAAGRLGIPSVSTTHSLLRPWPILTGAAFVTRVLCRKAAVFTAVSAAAARDVAVASRRPVQHIPNGIRLTDWRIEPNIRTGRDDVHVVAVTRLVRKKSPVDLVRALGAAARSGRPHIRMTVAGDGPEQQAMAQEAARLSVSDLLTFRGRCSRAEVHDLLRTASIFAQPGRREAFGLAALEALAAGVPVVAMRSGGVGELVEHERNGLLATSAADFGGAMARLCTDDRLRARCAAQAPLGLERFDWSRVVAQYERVYLDVTGTQTSGRHVKNNAAATA